MTDIDLASLRSRKVIPLSKPIPSPHNGEPEIKQVVLKEPSGGDYRKIGEPRIVVRSGQGAYFVEQNEAISAYFEKCIDHDLGATLVDLLSLADAMRVKMELLGFFTDAEQSALSKS